MRTMLLLTLFPFLFLATSVSAQSPCQDCLKAAQAELRACLANAISEEDKIECENKQGEQAKVCEDSECRVEREKAAAPKDNPPQGR